VTYTDASPTVAELYPKMVDAIQKVQSTFFGGPNAIIMHPRRLGFIMASLDTTNRPLVVPAARNMNGIASGNGAVEYGNSGYEMFGLPIITDANVSTAQGAGTNQDTIYVGNLQELHLWEDGNGEPMYLRFEQTKGAELDGHSDLLIPNHGNVKWVVVVGTATHFHLKGKNEQTH